MKKILFTFIFISSLSPLLSSAQESCTNSGCITYEGKQYCEVETKILYGGKVATCPDTDKDGVPGCTLGNPNSALDGYCVGLCSVAGGMSCYYPNLPYETAPDCNDMDPRIKRAGDFSLIVTYDKQYVDDTISKRKFDPRNEPSLTPIDDIRITIPKICGHLPTYDESLGGSYDTSIKAQIYIKAGDQVFPVFDGKLSQSADGSYTYLLKGFPDGWVGTGFDQLTDEMSKGHEVKIEVVLQTNVRIEPTLLSYSEVERSVEAILIPPNSGMCARLYGNGEHKLIYMTGGSVRGRDALRRTISFVPFFAKYRSSLVEPYKKYVTAFSDFVDLNQYSDEDMGIEMVPYGTRLEPTEKSLDDLFRIVKYKSSCRRGGSMYFYISDQSTIGLSILNSRAAFVYVQSPEYFENNAKTFLHEMGHGFAGLTDEYLYKGFETKTEENQNVSMAKFIGPNCLPPTLNSQDIKQIFSYGGKSYASPKIGCSTYQLYRPSEQSLMNGGANRTKFNVVSCGYIIAAIKGGNPKSYWSECAGLDTVPITQ
jgi:hypothetical protein